MDTELTPYQKDCLGTVSRFGGVAAHDPQRHPRLLEDRVAQAGARVDSRSRLSGAVADVVRLLSPQAAKKGLELMHGHRPRRPRRPSSAIPSGCKQVLTNLVGNALKFTERGRIVIAVREDSRQAGSTKLQFSVTDTGMGIPENKQAHIFEAFSQADGSTTRRFGGTGLGLAISSTLVASDGRTDLAGEPVRRRQHVPLHRGARHRARVHRAG